MKLRKATKIVEGLAEILAGVREVQARLVKAEDADMATELEMSVIEPLEDVSIDVDSLDTIEGPDEVEAAVKSGNTMRWTCCKAPARGRTRTGKSVWKAWCKWEKAGRTGGMTRVVRKDGSKCAPKKIKIKNRIMHRCD